MTSTLPLLITYMVIGLNVTVNQMKFEKSPQSQSEICPMHIPLLNKISQATITEYLARHKPGFECVGESIRWRVLRYNISGFMIPHTDDPRPFKDYEHIATEIYIPPATQVQYDGGQLVVKQNKQVYKISAHPTQWTYIFMPLGLVHKIKPVTSGFRISYTKSVYVQAKAEKPQIETSTNSGDF